MRSGPRLSPCGRWPFAAAVVDASSRGVHRAAGAARTVLKLTLANRPMLGARGRAKGKNIPLNPEVTTFYGNVCRALARPYLRPKAQGPRMLSSAPPH
jgi:hypothetical protein